VSTATALSKYYEHAYPGEPEQVALARHDVARYLNGHPLTDDAVLIVSELATNAVLYSGSAGRTFILRAELFAGYLWLEVEDLAGVEWERKAGDGTHGLDIVTALSGEWDAEDTGDGTRVVWARLELP
jgi:anti-sigma regulatory factor (Ser/Thr protein kinase)